MNAFNNAKSKGLTLDNKKVHNNYKMFSYMKPDLDDNSMKLPGELGEILPGDPMYKAPVTESTVNK